MLIKYLKNVRKYDISDCSFVEEKATDLKRKKDRKKDCYRERNLYLWLPYIKTSRYRNLASVELEFCREKLAERWGLQLEMPVMEMELPSQISKFATD